jgi:hypothetical protein
MNFSPNRKTLEYIYSVCENKITCSPDFKSVELKYMNAQLQKKMIGEYSINGEVFEFDRNVILYLHALRNLISLEFPYSQKTKTVYKEIVSVLNTIESSFVLIKKEPNNIFMIKPTEFFTMLLKLKNRGSPIFSAYMNLAKEYLHQLEYMAYTIINRIDELDFDLRSYSDDFFKTFLALDLGSESRP